MLQDQDYNYWPTPGSLEAIYCFQYIQEQIQAYQQEYASLAYPGLQNWIRSHYYQHSFKAALATFSSDRIRQAAIKDKYHC